MMPIDSTRMLMEMRSLALKANAQAVVPEAVNRSGPAGDFGAAMKAAIGQVNALQGNAQAAAASFESGAPGVDLTGVMLEVQKASLAFKAMTEVRNRLVSAYQEVMNMPI